MKIWEKVKLNSKIVAILVAMLVLITIGTSVYLIKQNSEFKKETKALKIKNFDLEERVDYFELKELKNRGIKVLAIYQKYDDFYIILENNEEYGIDPYDFEKITLRRVEENGEETEIEATLDFFARRCSQDERGHIVQCIPPSKTGAYTLRTDADWLYSAEYILTFTVEDREYTIIFWNR